MKLIVLRLFDSCYLNDQIPRHVNRLSLSIRHRRHSRIQFCEYHDDGTQLRHVLFDCVEGPRQSLEINLVSRIALVFI